MSVADEAEAERLEDALEAARGLGPLVLRSTLTDGSSTTCHGSTDLQQFWLVLLPAWNEAGELIEFSSVELIEPIAMPLRWDATRAWLLALDCSEHLIAQLCGSSVLRAAYLRAGAVDELACELAWDRHFDALAEIVKQLTRSTHAALSEDPKQEPWPRARARADLDTLRVLRSAATRAQNADVADHPHHAADAFVHATEAVHGLISNPSVHDSLWDVFVKSADAAGSIAFQTVLDTWDDDPELQRRPISEAARRFFVSDRVACGADASDEAVRAEGRWQFERALFYLTRSTLG